MQIRTNSPNRKRHLSSQIIHKGAFEDKVELIMKFCTWTMSFDSLTTQSLNCTKRRAGNSVSTKPLRDLSTAVCFRVVPGGFSAVRGKRPRVFSAVRGKRPHPFSAVRGKRERAPLYMAGQ